MLWSDVTPTTITWGDPTTIAYLMTEDGKYITTEAGEKIIVALGTAWSNPNWLDVAVT